MKAIPSVLILFLFACCCAQKPVALSSATGTSNCPVDGDCTVEFMKNKSLKIRYDDLGGRYYNLLDNPDKDVVVYKYTKHRDTQYADNGYQEEIIIEIDRKNPEVQSGENLQEANILFGRFCMCRGETGYFPISDGNLSIKRQKQGMLLNLNFKISEVPQIIDTIEIILK